MSNYSEPQGRSGLPTALVLGAIIALVAANIYLYVQIDQLKGELAETNKTLHSGMTNINASSVTIATQQHHLETLKADLEATRRAAATMSAEAAAKENAHAEQLVKQIANEQAKMEAALGSQINDVKQTSAASVAAANSKIDNVATDVGTVRTQASQTQDQLNKTIADLKSVTGDMGVASGLIATNGKELAALRLKGERNYTDIKLGKTKQPQRFGDIALRLDSVNPKKNSYSVYILADDKLTFKQNKSINEPVQFYTAKGGHTPYELVINQVTKDTIIGYVSTPKDATAR
jgi:septal ring factor EnvC (AmiA/AmiB activator)